MPKPGRAGPAGVAKTPAAVLTATRRCIEPLAQ